MFSLFNGHPASGATCDTAGIIQPAVQLVVAHQITEALKILVEDFGALRETMLSFDLWNNQQMAFKVNRQKKILVYLAEGYVHIRV